MSKTKVLHIIRRSEGGMKKHLLSLVRLLDKEKYQIAIFCSFDQETQEYLKGLGIQVFEVDIDDGINFKKDYKAIKSIRKIVSEFKPDIVHMHGAKASLVGRIACYNKPVKSVVTVHNFLNYNNMNLYKKKLILGLSKILDKKTSQFIAVSNALKNDLILNQNVDKNKIKVVYNCIDTTFYDETSFDLRKELNLPENSFVVGSIARLIPAKGVQDLIKAASILKNINAYFVIAGDGPFKEELQKMIEGLNLKDKFFLLGYRRDIPAFLRNLDVFVLPSHEEGFGISVIEALNEGIPVVATKVGGISEIIEDGINGILVEKGNHIELAKAIQRLLTDEELRKRLSLKGKNSAEKYSCKKMVEEIEQIYDSLKGR
ncbi:putative glycosyltransferase [Thermoanaerobacter kivui]|uniref:Putative glycosyltransferase n=1 Tax=Thermoanaerobacter kivui TaxID=2325 RepID=A0A097AQT5_THEKI|nr:glycosyltransferase family 4 protein [Thermoanaerobacter kivui]AIS52162.1 putative glycosyltransferase [Thermoanaerobacter kivui]